MKVVAVVGPAGSGKTALIEQIVAELKRRRLSVAVVKHCSRGFNLDQQGKDSWRFKEAGSDGVGLISPEEIAIIQRQFDKAEDLQLATSYFKKMDFVLIEGRHTIKHIPKVELLRKGVAERVATPVEELAAVVSNFDVKVPRPVFHFSQINEITNFLEKEVQMDEPRVVLEIDGAIIPLNPFVQSVSANMLLGIVRSLKDTQPDPQKITLRVIRRNREDEKS
jgi:molybdopterin-guanine dinucleotide biosynthesis protein B